MTAETSGTIRRCLSRQTFSSALRVDAADLAERNLGAIYAYVIVVAVVTAVRYESRHTAGFPYHMVVEITPRGTWWRTFLG